MSEFLQQDDARRSRILQAALEEFASKGYKKASTNTIVREAGVSKGLLFHYFISKKHLYIYLYTFAVETIANELYEKVNFADKDVLNRVSQSSIVKIESYLDHPLFVDLFKKVDTVDDPEIIEQLIALGKRISEETYLKLFSNIDYYAFNDAINIDRALQVIRWTVEKISEDWRASHEGRYTMDDYEELKMDISHYLDLFKGSFYR